MPDIVIPSVQTRGVGFAPILKHYLERCRIREIIDENVPLDPLRTALTHGEASVAMITGVLFQVMQLYRICTFAKETNVLKVILPGIAHQEYFDDRLADTLEAIQRYGIGNLEMLLTREMIREFKLKTDICHNDTTTASVFGNCNNNKTLESIEITYGHSKKHREDLKQLVWSLSVSSDSGFPLFQQAYSGNTADVDTYVHQWSNLVDLLNKRDFLYVADSKLIAKENMAHIHDNAGFFIGPAPMYECYKTVFHNALDQHEHELLIPYKKQINRGFEVPMPICHGGKEYPFRMIILYDHGLFAIKSHGLRDRIERTEQAFSELATKLNKRKLKTREAIEEACNATLDKHKTKEFFDYTISSESVVTLKNKGQGRPAKGKVQNQVEVVTERFGIELRLKDAAFVDALYRCGYYPLITNKPQEDLSIEAAMLAYKSQYRVEHLNRRAKSGYKLEPVYLHTPERIEAYLLLFKIALQLIVLMERSARKNIESRGKGLDNFMPNRKDVRNPRAEYMLKVFEYVVCGVMPLPDGRTFGFVSELTPLQKDILEIMEIPFECFSYERLFDTG